MLKYKMIHNRGQQSSKSWCIFDAGLQLLGWRFAFPKPFASTKCLRGDKVWTQSTEPNWDHTISLLLKILPNCIIGQHLELKPKGIPSSSVAQWAAPAHPDPGREAEYVWAVPSSSHTPPLSGLLKPMNGNC